MNKPMSFKAGVTNGYAFGIGSALGAFTVALLGALAFGLLFGSGSSLPSATTQGTGEGSCSVRYSG
jgi:hypothetical protein